MNKILDILLSLCLIIILSVPVFIIAVLVRLTSRGPALYWSDRVGIVNKIFKMPKFRTMRIETPAVATHLLTDPDAYLTPIGPFLRKWSLDELPQLWSVLKGDMVDKYTEDIAVEGRIIQRELGFGPPYDLKAGWEETIREMKGK